MPPTKAPTCHSDSPDDVRAEFDYLVDLLGGRATSIDSLMLEMLAANLATWRRAVRHVDEVGTLVMSGGTMMANPNIAIASAAQGQILGICNQLGIPAALRRRLGGDRAGRGG